MDHRLESDMKIYASNPILAQQLLETAFGLMRNEKQRPADIMEVVYQLLTSSIDVGDKDQDALHDFLQLVVREGITSPRLQNNFPENTLFRERLDYGGQ